jgi:hypothetical protein
MPPTKESEPESKQEADLVDQQNQMSSMKMTIQNMNNGQNGPSIIMKPTTITMSL